VLWVLEVLIHIHTVVEDSNHNDLGFHASSVKDDMAALTELFVPGLYVIRIAAYFRLASKQLEGIIKLLEVFVALPLSPFFSGKAANINKVFSSGGGE
jgi:malonyl CoA-acyl carrier protein transacylase